MERDGCCRWSTAPNVRARCSKTSSINAALDDANVGRFAAQIAEMSEKTQFIVITHNKRTMEAARALYGVTMQEAGVSKIVSVKFE